jgi:hypothetical protein
MIESLGKLGKVWVDMKASGYMSFLIRDTHSRVQPIGMS